MQQLSTKMQQIEWRRDRVLELSSQGFTQSDIATMLQVDKSIISRDLGYLRQQAQENLKQHIHEIIPEEYQKCMTGMKRNLKQILEIAESSPDPRIKLQARAAAGDSYKYIMELCTNASIISDAMKFVNQKTEQLDTLTLRLKTTNDNDNDTEIETAKETNKVF